jgi:hypothetical protein
MTDSSWEAKVLLANNPPAEEKELFSGGEWKTVTTRRDDKTYIVHTLYLDDAARQKFVTWPESSKLEGQELLGVLFTCGACAKDRIAPDGEVIPMQLGTSVATGAVLWFCTAMPSERSSDNIIEELNRGVPKGPPLWLRRIQAADDAQRAILVPEKGEDRQVGWRTNDGGITVFNVHFDRYSLARIRNQPIDPDLKGEDLLHRYREMGGKQCDYIAADGHLFPALFTRDQTGQISWALRRGVDGKEYTYLSREELKDLNNREYCFAGGSPLAMRLDQCEEPSPIRSLGTNRRLLLAGLGLAAAMGFLGGGGAVLITTSTLFLVLGGVLALNKLIESKDAVVQPPSKQSAAPAIKKALKPKNALAPNLARNMLIFTVHVLLDGLKRAAGMGAPSREVLHERMQDGVARQAPRAVRRAVKMGAPVENRITMPDFTGSLVGWSAANGHVPLLEALLKKGASPDSPHDDKPALLQAVAGYHPVAVSRLLAAGTTASVQDALAVAERNGHTDIAKDLSDIAIGHRVVEEIVEGPWRVLECQAAPAFSKAAAAESEAVAELEVSAPSSRRMTL